MKNLQGKEAINRMLELMGKAPINEGSKNSVVELTKVGPDGKVYGIVRENHEYYIKIANKADNLVVESFDYIGGLSNKKNEAYSSYSKAIKQLNLKFMSLNESIGKFGQVNVFLNDNLINEHHPYKADQKLSATKGMGDGEEYIVDEKGAELTYKAKEGKAEDGFGDNVAEKVVEKEFEKVKLSENESLIDAILEGTEDVNRLSFGGVFKEFGNTIKYIGKDYNFHIEPKNDKFVVTMHGVGYPNGKELGEFSDVSSAKKFILKKDNNLKEGIETVESKRKGFSIEKAVNEMDDIINSVNVKSKVTTLLEGLTTEEMTELTNALKKKV
jgi:hypothetical protein